MTTRAAVTLREITDTNRVDVIGLSVAPEQTAFVDGVADSLAEAAATPEARPWFRAIYADETPVGFVMVTDGVPRGHPEFVGPITCGGCSSTPGTSAAGTAGRPSTWSWSTSGAARVRSSS